MNSLERWLIAVFTIIVLSLTYGGYAGMKGREDCRMEAMKQNRSADEIVKICR